MDRLFLDANVLLSAAYRVDAGVRVLWTLHDAQLVTSSYAVQEARRNLAAPAQQQALDDLLKAVRVVGHQSAQPLPGGVSLPAKDQPILAAAIDAKCTHLITGDVHHFGPLFGNQIGGVLILRPAAYAARRPR
ncbi:MAG: PIN domain-containing protein [Deltaproteobacteria bacterium]|nr:PIN domain-containing protein [Deltaproteobacteria bacterium]